MNNQLKWIKLVESYSLINMLIKNCTFSNHNEVLN